MIHIRYRAILLTLGLILQAIIVCFSQPGQDKAKSLLENLSDTGNRPLLMNTLQHAGLTPVLTSEGSYTFLVPSEASLAKLKSMPPETVRSIISYHIIMGKYKVEDLKDGSKLKTLQGGTISVCRKKGKLLLNGLSLAETNAEASNGYWHALDGILMPK